MATTIGTIVAKLLLNVENFSSNLSKVQGEMEATKKKLEGLGKLGDGFEDVGKKMTKSITLPIVGLGTAAVAASTNFEQAMSKVKAISNATGEEMEMLNKKAIEMGAKTKFSAKESADAFTYMAMAGWDVKSMMDGIDGIMNLAAADGLDLATTSDIVTDALTGFGLAAKDSAHFADVLAVASSASNTNVSMLGESFKYIAPVAGALKYSIEDTAVALGLMANAGVKASQAGTTLRMAITRMIKPPDEAAEMMNMLGISVTKADGSMKSFNELLINLRKSFANLSESQKAEAATTIFGVEAMSGMLAIITASDKDFNNLTKQINDADGAAERMAETMMDNTAGAIEQMMGSLETLAIQIGDIITPAIRTVAGSIQSFSDWLGTLDRGTQGFITTIGLFLAAIGPVTFTIGKIINGFIKLKTWGGVIFTGLKALWAFTTTSMIPTLGSFIAALLPFIPAILGISAVITAIILVVKNWGAICDWFSEKWKQFTDWLGKVFDTFVDFFLNGALEFMRFWYTLPTKLLSALLGLPEKLYQKAREMIQQLAYGVERTLGLPKGAIADVATAIMDGITWLPRKFFSWGQEMVENLGKGISSMIDWIKDKAKGIADSIARFLHFTKPDEGPLRPYETWMPDFIQGLTETLGNSKGKLIKSVMSLSESISDAFSPKLSLAGTFDALNYDTNEYDRLLKKNIEIDGKGSGNESSKSSRSDTIVNLNIEHFHNESKQDIRQLTREVMEVAEEENKRKRGTFGDAEKK